MKTNKEGEGREKPFGIYLPHSSLEVTLPPINTHLHCKIWTVRCRKKLLLQARTL